MEDRGRVLDYTKPVKLPYDCNKVRKNFTQGYFDREIGRYKNSVPSEFQWAAEDKLINKNSYEELKCQIPDSPRSTFLMVFSPDGKKVASTHGNHNVYVTDLTTGKNIQTLSGHPRTPWCIAFHPSSNQILASGCLGGQVRVWDLHGGSEVWTAESQTVIASLAFHPVDRMLVIATYNELHFWDWSQPEPFAKCSTKSEREKVRYVSFDRLGSKLITGIANPVNIPSQRDRVNVVNSQPPATTTSTTSVNSTPPTTVATTQASSDQGRSITFCYRHLMNQYNQLVSRYFDLSRSRITPTIDRGTDPMDLLDLRTSGANSESSTSTSNPSSSTSNSQTNSSSSPLRFKITRSACRSYRPLNSRISVSTTTTTASQNSTFPTPPSVSTPVTHSSSSPRGRRFSLAPISRSWCLTLSPENSSNLFSTRTTAQSTVSSEAVTNPTYSSYSNRAIFSTRESTPNNSERSHFSVIPYRLLFNESDDSSPPRRTPPSVSDDGFVNPSILESRADSLLTELRGRVRPFRRDFIRQQSERSRSPNRDSTLHSPNDVEVERELQRPVSSLFLRRQDLESSRDQFTTPRQAPSQNADSSSNVEFSRNVGHSSTFYLAPMDLRNVSPVRRFREAANSDVEPRTNPPPPPRCLMHHRPVPRFQVRSRLLQEPQSQLHLITNRETHGLNLQNNQSLRRQLSFRPGGQFVLSRHSNSPFQPRTPHHIDSPTPANSPTSIKDTRKRPEIPSVRSSFTTSISPSTNSLSSSSSAPSSSGNGLGSVASNLSFTGEGTSRQIFEQINRHLFDRVKKMLRDRIRNSSENASTDSTVNYSRISGESEIDTRNPLDNSTESEESPARGLGPRGADPLLSSASENLDISNDTLLLSNSENSSPVSGTANGTLSNGNRVNMPQSELLDPWESESEIIPLPLPLNDVLNEHASQETQTPRNPAQENSAVEETSNLEPSQTSSSSSNNNNNSNNSNNNTSTVNSGLSDDNLISSPESSMRQGIQLLSLHIENMQRLCWARIEILQLQKIRRMWEDLTKQIRHFHNTIQNRNRDGSGPSRENDSSNPTGYTRSGNDSAGDEPPVTASTSRDSTSSYASNDDGINRYEELVQSFTNELFRENREESNSSAESNISPGQQEPSSNDDGNNTSSSSSAGRCSTNDTEEPQPGPSGVSTPGTSSGVRDPSVRGERLKFRVYKLLLDTIHKTRKKRDTREGGSSSSNEPQRPNHQFRMRNSSRPRFRSQRPNRNFDSPTFRSRTLSRELEIILQTWKNEKISSRPSQTASSTSTSDMDQPSTSSSRPSTSTDACLSCGQKKKPTKDSGGQKRRNSDSSSEAGSSSSASKVLKNNVGERSEAPSREEPNATNNLPTDHDNASTSGTQENSTNELLRQMIQTMETMLRFQREAFHRSEDLARTRPAAQQSLSLPSSSTDDHNNEQTESNEAGNLPRSSQSQRNTERLIVSLMRDITPFRAKRLLGYMLKSLTQFFGKNLNQVDNLNNLNQVVGEQIFSLYMLLHLALELTDLLLDQLRTRSRDLERTWAVDNVNSSESRQRNFLLSRPSTASGLSRDRSRSMTRGFQNPTLGIGREESQRSRGPSSHFMRSHPRLIPTRLGSSTLPNTGHNRSGITPSNYIRRRRVCARLSSAFAFGWHRYGRTPPQSNNTASSSSSTGRGVNPANLTSIRCENFRFDRRNSGGGQSQSGNRILEGEINNNNNNSSNNNHSNDSNNNLTSNNDGNNNINSNTVNNSTRNSNSDSNNNSNGYRNSASGNNASDFSNINNNSNVNSNFLNYYFPSSGSSNNSDSSNSNNIIIVTGLNSGNDLINNSSNSSNGSNSSNSYGGNRNTNSEGNNPTNSSRQGRSNSPFLSQNPLPPLRSMELTLSRNENGDLSFRDERPIFWIRYGGNNDASGSSNSGDSQSRVSSFTVPVVQVNDVPVSDVSMLNQPRHRPQSPVWRVPEDIWRWRAWRPRFLHPRYSGPNPFDDQDSNDVSENIHYYRILSTSAGSHLGVYALDPMIITDAPLSPHHRIQAWDFSQMNIPDISDREANGVVPECKIHNDASVDVSNDGHLLVTLLPSGRLSVTTMLGVYSLDWSSLGQLLYRTSFEQNAVSVSLSPTNRHLLVGLASRPVVVRDRMNMAQIFRLEGGRPSPNGGNWHSKRGRLVHMRDLEQTRETNIMSLNCIRWAPGAGQGLVYGTNTGQLKVLR